MKFKKINLVALLTLSGVSFASLAGASFINFDTEINVSDAAWSGPQVSDYDANFYQSCEGLSKGALVDALRAFNNPEVGSYDYVGSIDAVADLAEGSDDQILCLYTRTLKPAGNMSGSYGWNLWNREHVCPQGKYPRSRCDGHNVYACEGKINNTRSHFCFADLKDNPSATKAVIDYKTGTVYPTDCYYMRGGGSKMDGYFEPPDAAKGEVARAIMYCNIYYNYEIENYLMKDLETLLRWHELDPVDDRDIYRNNKVAEMQGNRNPFVDHPEYARAIYGDGQIVGPGPNVFFDKTSYSLEEGEKINISTSIKNGTGTVNVVSQDPNIAKLENNVLTGVKPGTTKLVATATIDGEQYVKEANVTVTKKIILEKITLSNDVLSIEVGRTGKLTVTPTPANASSNVTWSTSNKDVASVDNGTITAISEGEAVITATSTKDSNIKASCQVSVIPPSKINGYKIVDPSEHDFTGRCYIANGTDGNVGVLLNNPTDSTNNFKTLPVANQIIATDDDALAIDIVRYNNKYKLTTANGTKCIVKPSGGNSIGVVDVDDPNAAVDISMDSNGSVRIISQGGTLMYNVKWGGYRFYNNPSQSPVYLYRSSSAENTLKGFNDTFINTVTCDGKGSMTAANNAWDLTKAYFNLLSQEDKDTLKNAKHDHPTVGEAVKRYDYIIEKYGVAKFDNYIGRTIEISNTSSNIASNSLADSASIIAMVIAAVAIVSTSVIGVIYIVKNKKDE